MNTPKFSIPTPCHENWISMTPDAQGRFCSQCSKTVVDFTGIANSEIENYLEANSSNSVCGRFKTEQLHPQKRSARVALASLIVSVSATLVSCDKNTVDEQVIDTSSTTKDSIAATAIDTAHFEMGLVMRPKGDSSSMKQVKFVPLDAPEEKLLTDEVNYDKNTAPAVEEVKDKGDK